MGKGSTSFDAINIVAVATNWKFKMIVILCILFNIVMYANSPPEIASY